MKAIPQAEQWPEGLGFVRHSFILSEDEESYSLKADSYSDEMSLQQRMVSGSRGVRIIWQEALAGLEAHVEELNFLITIANMLEEWAQPADCENSENSLPMLGEEAKTSTTLVDRSTSTLYSVPKSIDFDFHLQSLLAQKRYLEDRITAVKTDPQEYWSAMQESLEMSAVNILDETGTPFRDENVTDPMRVNLGYTLNTFAFSYLLNNYRSFVLAWS